MSSGNINLGSANAPSGMAYDSARGEVFVATIENAHVLVISDATDTVVATVLVGITPTGVAYDLSKGEVFVANAFAGTVSVILDTDNSVVATIPVGSLPGDSPNGVAYDSGKGEVFVPNAGSNSVSVISDATNPPAVIATVKVEGNPLGVAYDSGKGEVFVTNANSNTVSVISDATNTVIATIPAQGTQPAAVAYDSGTGQVFVAFENSGTVNVISDATDTVVASICAGCSSLAHNLAGLAYDPSTGQVFVTNDASTPNFAGPVYVISDSTDKVVATIPVQLNPIGIAFDSGRQEMFVGNSGSNSVSVISTASVTSATVDNQVTPAQDILAASILTVDIAPRLGAFGKL
jgi:YVTN family beta-propeller protein